MIRKARPIGARWLGGRPPVGVLSLSGVLVLGAGALPAAGSGPPETSGGAGGGAPSTANEKPSDSGPGSPLAVGRPAEGGLPRWSAAELRGFLAEVEAAGRHPAVAQKDAALALALARSYGVAPEAEESTEALARRVLRGRDPDHPPVREGQALVALARQAYLDVADRARTLARFTRDRRERQWLTARAEEAAKAAEVLSAELEVRLEGRDGFLPLPPRVGGDPPTKRGAHAELVGGRLIVERLPRADFRSGRAADASRTRKGSLREVYAALRQFDTTARMLGRYDPEWRRKRGHVQANLPAVAPAAVLNELARAAREADGRVLHLVTLDRSGAVRELPLHLRELGQGDVPVSCPDDERLDACARRLAHAHTRGRVVYRPDGAPARPVRVRGG